MEVSLEYVNCGFCGSEKHKILYPAPENSPYSKCNIVSCSECGLVRTNPRPTQAALTELYPSCYYSRQLPNLKGWGNQWKIFAMKHSQINLYPYVIPFKIPPNASICDVGCGSGEWLARMRASYGYNLR